MLNFIQRCNDAAADASLRIRRIRPEYRLPESWTLLHDNAPAHAPTLLTRFYAENKIIVLSHPPYSPDLDHADYFLFPKLKFKMKSNFFDFCNSNSHHIKIAQVTPILIVIHFYYYRKTLTYKNVCTICVSRNHIIEILFLNYYMTE